LDSNNRNTYSAFVRAGMVLAFVVAPFLTACGGGGGGEAPTAGTSIGDSTVVDLVDSSGGETVGGGTSSDSTKVISTAPGDGVDVEMNSLGTAVAVWQDRSQGGIWSSRFENGTWGTRVQISSHPATNAHVAVNSSGEAVAVWELPYQVPTAGLESTVWASHYRGGGWTAPTQISVPHTDGDGLSAFGPVVGMDDTGNAIVAWLQDEAAATARNAWITRYSGNTWNAPTRLSDGIHNVNEIEMAMNSAGDAAIVWRQDTYTYSQYTQNGGYSVPNMWAARYSGSTWSAPSLIGDPSLAGFDGCEGVNVAMNAGGDAVAAWRQHKGPVNSITANVYKPGPSGQWLSAPLTIASPLSGDVAHASVDLSDTGDIFVGWEQGSDISWTEETAWVRRFAVASGNWDGPLQLSIASSNVVGPLVKADGVGRAYATWYETGAVWGTSGWKMNRFDPSTGWDAKQGLPTGDIQSLDLAAAGNGYAALVFDAIDYSGLYFPEYVAAITWP